MKLPLPLSNSDLMLLRNSLISFVVLSGLSIAIYVTASGLQRSANESLNSARVYFDQVSNSVTQIAQEEETIIRYIDRYIQIAADGIVSEQDRLVFLERMTSIREMFQLYALGLSMGEQISHIVPYPPEDPLPGDPLTMHQTPISLELSLLHEGDLLRLFDRLLSLPGLFQPTECVVDLDSSSTEGLTQLRENLSARCRINWYSFDLSPPDSSAQEGV
ncbi:MAG: hypothetical protein Q8S94_09875 [Pseudohongiella sp.]|nr:hypothetical protein [Pseudohongiella sp.]